MVFTLWFGRLGCVSMIQTPHDQRRKESMADRSPTSAPPTADPEPMSQHSLALSIVLHLLPGAALTVFIVLAAPVVTSFGFPVVFALFAGIALVIAPIELGILLLHAWRTTGSFQLESTYRCPFRDSRELCF